MIKMYYVGGYVRDYLLNRKYSDIDIAVEANSYEEMKEYLLEKGYKIFLENPEYYTIRAQDVTTNINGKYLTADFVLCRKDGYYKDGRHPESVSIGTLYDDCSRRDFTINAMAIDYDTGELIDYFNGKNDLENKIIKCVGSPSYRFNEDCLRILRAIRFSVILNFELDSDLLYELISNHDKYSKMLKNIPIERIQNELSKMMKVSTYKSLNMLYNILDSDYRKVILNDDKLWFNPIIKYK
jgi:tRNA nucleotidyltransferase (CCA-adding enzyme)